MVIKKNGNSTFEIKIWFVVLSIIFMVGSFAYGFSMTFNLNPLKTKIENLIIKTNKQDEINNEQNIKIDRNKIQFENIKEDLKEIKQILRDK